MKEPFATLAIVVLLGMTPDAATRDASTTAAHPRSVDNATTQVILSLSAGPVAVDTQERHIGVIEARQAGRL